jgi:uncharacterized protein (DUF2236 family)
MSRLKRPGKTSRGLFSPEDYFWRVNRELLVNLAGSRALMMELAHPLIAAGVADHSNFRRRPLGRLYRTARAMTDITFGTTNAVHRAARHINHCHQHVHGILAKDAAPFPGGTKYHANDPALKLWVLATLVDSVPLVYDLFVRPLSPVEREGYYQDSRLLAPLFGIPGDMMPASYSGFTSYMEEMLNSELIAVGNTARELVKALFAGPVIGTLTLAASVVGIGLLPERLRRAYNFSWDDRRDRVLRGVAGWSRRVRPLVPSLICISPRAWIAERLSIDD